MIPRPAQYLLRFDDLCPTMSIERWQAFESMIERFGVRPILAVTPDNRDPELMVSETGRGFWERMRRLESVGATIAMHGFHHLCKSRGRGLLSLHRETEFAGVDANVQRRWIRKGLEILRGHGLSPRLWVAPRHGFDSSTLHALNEEGIGYLSDGFARVPLMRGGVIWIPQQLWEPVHKSKGLWTICIHSNTVQDSAVDRLERFLAEESARFTSFDRVIAEYAHMRANWAERVYETVALLRHRRRQRGL